MVEPVYLSSSGQFFVTAYIDRKTATEIIYKTLPDNQAGQAYRRAGEWLNALHKFNDPVKKRFWYQWIFENIEDILSTSVPQAQETEYQPFLEQMRRDAEKLDGVHELKVFAHGDFHGRNLILGSGVTYGLDFTEVTEN